MVNYGTDLVVMGGDSNWSLSPSFYQLSVENGIFKWEKMKQELKTPSAHFVAMTIPDRLLEVQQRRKRNPVSNGEVAKRVRH